MRYPSAFPSYSRRYQGRYITCTGRRPLPTRCAPSPGAPGMYSISGREALIPSSAVCGRRTRSKGKGSASIKVVSRIMTHTHKKKPSPSSSHETDRQTDRKFEARASSSHPPKEHGYLASFKCHSLRELLHHPPLLLCRLLPGWGCRLVGRSIGRPFVAALLKPPTD